MYNLIIKEIEVYHGKKVVGNDYYINHFQERGKDVKHFLEEIIGRDKRYMIDENEENSLTMAMNAVNGVMKKAGIKGTDIDMIIYSSFFPEYVIPPCSLHIHNAIEGKRCCMCYDLNTNCAGMTISLDLVSKYMQSNSSINRVLIVGSDYINPFLNPENELCYGHYGDAACAIIVERTNEEHGVLGSQVYINSSEHNNILFPKNGASKIKSSEEWLIGWKPFKVEIIETAANNMKKILEENNLTVDDVKMFCFSQYAIATIEGLRESLKIDESKSMFIGNEYGYTGTSSPFIVLYEAVKKGLVKRGDYVMFWTVGGGSQNISLLIKY